MKLLHFTLFLNKKKTKLITVEILHIRYLVDFRLEFDFLVLTSIYH